MSGRVQRILGSLLAALAGYWAYSLLLVPLLEPSIKLSHLPLTAAASAPAPVTYGFGHLFPPSAWELVRPKVLETDRGTLIFDDYRTLPQGRLQLNRCALLLQSPRGSPEGRDFVLRAPGGATLFFDGELNITRGEFGRLLGGELAGEVTIYSPPTPGREDGLEIRCRDVRIQERRIWTPHDVSFKYGPNVGSGGDLSIVLHPPESTGGDQRSAVSPGKVKALELVRVDRISLQMPAGKFSVAGADSRAATPQAAEPTTPVEITCQGSLRFDFDEQLLSLNRNVDVIRHNVDGPSDQLNCEQLLLYFQGQQTARTRLGQPDRTEPPMAALAGRIDARRIVAIGAPVTLYANSLGTSIRAERLEFDFLTRRIWIQDRQSLLLQNDRYQLQTTELEYELGPAGRLGRMWAAGPGRVQGWIGDGATRGEATWSGEARLQPFDGAQVLSLAEQVRISSEHNGNLSADELHLFLLEIPRSADATQFTILPDRMKAVGNIELASWRLSGSLEEANIWFNHEPATEASGTTPLTGFADAAKNDPVPATGEEDSLRPTMHVSAQRLNAEIRLGDAPQVLQLAARGQVRAHQPGSANGTATLVVCDLLQLVGGDTANPVATLTGQPARASAEGASILGETLRVELGANVAAVEGPGEMTIPAVPNRLAVAWRQQMQFDGQRASFAGQVAVRGTQHQDREQLEFTAAGEVLNVTLSRFVRFQEVTRDQPDKIALREIAFRGPALLESQAIDTQGLRKSLERMQVHDLHLDQAAGRLHGDGPGWLTSVRYGRDLFRDGQAPVNTEGLHFLRVDFERELVGDMNGRQVQFLGNVRSIYGPVSSWDSSISNNGTHGFGPRDVAITSQRLALADLGRGGERLSSLELQATGNAFVRGQSFTASGQRISYAKTKDLLILEGDGRNYAVLTYQHSPQATPAPLKARKILFWPSTKQFEVNDLHSVDLQNLSQWLPPGG